MKIANSIIGAFITIILMTGVLFKMMHWPGAGPMIVLSSTSLAIYVYFVAAANIISHKKNTLLKISNGLGAFFGSIVIIGFLFKTMHWPGGGAMLVIGIPLFALTLLFFMASFIFSKDPIKFSGGTFFSVISFGILAFGVAVQGPSYSILSGIVHSNQKTEIVIDNLAIELEFHRIISPHSIPYIDATVSLHNYIKNLKSKLYESIDHLPKEVADTICLERIMAKDNYDVPTHLMGLAEPCCPIKVSGLEEYSATTLKEKIQVFNDKMKALDVDFTPIETPEQYNYNGGIDSWETTTFYHMPLAQVILTLNLINAEALTKCNYYLVKNYPTTENTNGQEE